MRTPDPTTDNAENPRHHDPLPTPSMHQPPRRPINEGLLDKAHTDASAMPDTVPGTALRPWVTQC
jgi:hypothetical protein